MDLRRYWTIITKWLWLIMVIMVSAAIATYLISERQTPIYQASARLLVIQGTSNSPTLTYTDILSSQRMAATYAQIMTERPVLEATAETLGLESVRQLGNSITVSPVRDTQLLMIRVEHPDPALAAQIANTLPGVFAQYYEAQQSERFRESTERLQKQLDEINVEIVKIEMQLAETGEAQVAAVDNQRLLIENRLAQYRSSYSTLLAQLEQIRLAEANARDSITVAGPATVPLRPIRPRSALNSGLALLVGATLALGIAFLIEYLDDTIKIPDDISRVTGLSVLGVIARDRSTENAAQLVVITQPRSPISEAYRTVRTNIQFFSVDHPVRTLVVTSTGPGEGKSTVVANLAATIAQTGRKVILIDADLRKPTQHRRWGAPNSVGLTSLLIEEDLDLGTMAVSTSLKNLDLITSGPMPPNPAELVGSQKLLHLIDRLLKTYDMVLLDSPPILAVTDPVVLGRLADGVLLVAAAGETREPALSQAVQTLRGVDAHPLGVVLNKVDLRQRGGYYYYYGGYYRYENTGTDQAENRRESRNGRMRWASIGRLMRLRNKS